MADEAQDPPVEEQDQGTDSAPQEGTSAEQTTEKFSDVDLQDKPDEITPEWLQERYQQMQRDYTSKTQSLAEQRREAESAQSWVQALSDPDTQEDAFKALAEQLGYELDDAPDEGDDEDDLEDDEFRDPRVDELLAKQEQEQQAQQLEALAGHVEQLAKDSDLDLTDGQLKAIVRESIDAGFTPEATQKVFADWKADLDQFEEKVTKKYRQSKKAPSAPAAGKSGTPDVPITDDRARLARAMEVAAEQYSG